MATRECATMGVRAGTEHGAGVAGTDRVYRAAAVVALGSAVAALVVMCAAVRVHPWSMLGILVALPAAVIAGWHVVTRRGLARVLAGLIVLVAVVVPVLHVLAHRPAALLAAMVLFGFSMASARFALRPAGRRPRRGGRRRGARVTGAGRAVLLLNPRSGSGKAARLGLAALARQSGADVVPMRPGDDLGELAEDLVAGGAGVLGVAGGDGSMATVAAVAARHGLPFVCVPAGTRNHFALDLGLDPSDLARAMTAFRRGVEVRVDLAEVNGRAFVNNVSLGIYAAMVRSRALPALQGAGSPGRIARPDRAGRCAVAAALPCAGRRGTCRGPRAAGVQQPLPARRPGAQRLASAAGLGVARCADRPGR